MIQGLQHFIITPFNICLYEHPIIKDKNAWMLRRIELWKTYCLPSVANQTEKGFTWFMLFDFATPSAHMDIVKQELMPYQIQNNFIPVYLTAKNHANERWNYFYNCIKKESRYVMFTRLDNDDMWRRDFTANLHSYLLFEQPEKPTALNMPLGYCYDIRNKYMTTAGPEPSNPFISLLGKPGTNFRELFKSHESIGVSSACVEWCKDQRMWVRVIHGQNEANFASGKPTNKIEGNFGVEL